MSDADLYETDVAGWSEDQAARLRRIAAGERPNDVGVDWPNVIEEIEDVGKRERRAVVSNLSRALLHLLKAYGWPGHQALDHWMAEASAFLLNARSAVDPGMAQRLDLAAVYRAVRREADTLEMDGLRPKPLPAAVPLSFGDLRDDGPTALDLLRRIEQAAVAERGTPPTSV